MHSVSRVSTRLHHATQSSEKTAPFVLVVERKNLHPAVLCWMLGTEAKVLSGRLWMVVLGAGAMEGGAYRKKAEGLLL